MFVGYLLKQTQAFLRARMEEALRPLGLTTPQYVCLELLSRTPGATNSELARGAFVTRQTMNTLLHGLQDRGLVERPEQAGAGRRLPTSLTAEGRRLLDDASALTTSVDRRMTSLLSEAQLDSLRETLALCIEALSAQDTAPDSAPGSAKAGQRPVEA